MGREGTQIASATETTNPAVTRAFSVVVELAMAETPNGTELQFAFLFTGQSSLPVNFKLSPLVFASVSHFSYAEKKYLFSSSYNIFLTMCTLSFFLFIIDKVC